MEGELSAPVAGRDGYGGTPVPRATDRAERTAQRTLRLVGWVLTLSMGLNLLLGALLWSLFPLVRIQPALVQFSDKQFYKVEPVVIGGTAEKKVREAFARRYVAERETINLVDDRERWKWVIRQSTEKVWKPFLHELETSKVWEAMERNNETRVVRILGSWSLRDDPERWAVEYQREVYRGSERVAASVWVAQMYYGRIGGAAADVELFDNPYRLRVDRYTISGKSAISTGGQ